MATYGTMAVDHELRIDYDKLRRDRLEKVRAQMKKEGLGSLLCFHPDNVRYVTSTKLGEWTREKFARYCLVVEGKEDVVLFEVGSAMETKKKLCPWIKDIRPAKSNSCSAKSSKSAVIGEIYEILKEYGVQDKPMGVDWLTVPIAKEILKYGIPFEDGFNTMQECNLIKTDEEIAILELSAAMVDGAYYDVVEAIKPGIRENEVAGVMRKRLWELGAENVLNVNVISGDRAYPHPHDCTDRIIRPGDFVYLDIVNDFNGYKTCYYRTFSCGKPTDAQMEQYRIAYKWLYDAIKMVKPGVTTTEIASVWPKFDELPYPVKNKYEAVGFNLGHGVGIFHQGRPWMTRETPEDEAIVIQKNMHFALETYCGAEGIGGARIEEQVVVTDNGCRVITKFPCEEPFNCWK